MTNSKVFKISSFDTVNDNECDEEFRYVCIDEWTQSLWETCNIGTCRTWGAPHVETFDGLRNDIYGQATYQLSQTTNDAVKRGLPYFQAAMETLQVGHVAYASASYIEFGSSDGKTMYKIRFTEFGDSTISVNGGDTHPLNTQGQSAIIQYYLIICY